jgi:enamine deaminase RidA (YjgF/YER057c/UK114 family)
MDKQIIEIQKVHKPIGYSHAIRTGELIFVAGQVALDSEGNLVGLGDIVAQTEQVYHNLELILENAGSSLRDLVKLTVFLTRVEDLQPYRDLRDRLRPEPPPTSTLLVVTALARPEFPIEVEAVAMASKTDPAKRENLAR